MADQETWAKRVAEWKASGLSSPAFCEGKDFTPGGLRHMAHRLGVGRRPRPRGVRIAKVVRVDVARPPAPSPVPGSAIVVEIGAARVMVMPGVDRATLAAVLEVLTAAGSAQ
jgi:transposase